MHREKFSDHNMNRRWRHMRGIRRCQNLFVELYFPCCFRRGCFVEAMLSVNDLNLHELNKKEEERKFEKLR